MAVESITGASDENDLNVAWPQDTDYFSEGAAHIRNLKVLFQNLFEDGVANNAALLAGQAAAYYLDYNNFTSKPTLGALASKNTVGLNDIDNGAVNWEKLANGAVTPSRVAANAITADGLNVAGNGVAGQILSSDGDGSFSWINLVSGNIFDNFLHVRDERVSGTNAGTFNSGSWQTRVLNTVVTPMTGASLSSNQITLAAGTYYIEARAPSVKTSENKTRLRDVNGSTTVLLGTTERNGNSVTSSIDSKVTGILVITGTEVLELQHRCTSGTTTEGFGSDTGYGDTEIFAEFKAWKIS